MIGVIASSYVDIAPTLTGSFIGYHLDTSSASSYTFTDAPIGSSAADRYVVVCIAARTAPLFSSVTIGGVTATQVSAFNATSTNGVAIYWAAVPSGTTATVQVNLTNTPSRMGLAVYTLRGDPVVADSGSGLGALTLPSGGWGVAVSCNHNSTTITCSWTGMTEDCDFRIETGAVFMSTASTTDVDPTVSASWSANASSAATCHATFALA